jgi:hypothetical protein
MHQVGIEYEIEQFMPKLDGITFCMEKQIMVFLRERNNFDLSHKKVH